MAAIPASKKLSVNTPQAPRKNFAWTIAGILEIIGENILDMVVTIASLGMLLAYLFVTVPEVTIEYAGYIIWIYLIIMLLRIVHDFDESYTTDEVGKLVRLLIYYVSDMNSRIRSIDGLSVEEMPESELEIRFKSFDQ